MKQWLQKFIKRVDRHEHEAYSDVAWVVFGKSLYENEGAFEIYSPHGWYVRIKLPGKERVEAVDEVTFNRTRFMANKVILLKARAIVKTKRVEFSKLIHWVQVT
jgi:hypothetical protein